MSADSQPGASGKSPTPDAAGGSRPQATPPRPKVKSYLHKFYDCGSGGGQPSVASSDAELQRLLTSRGKKRQGGCELRPIVWKAMLWIGVNCLIFGALGLAVAFFLPREPELVELPGVQGFVRSRSNAEWNRSADALKYVALGVFGVGAAITAVGLVLPSLVWRLFDQEEEEGEDAKSAAESDSKSKKRLRRLLQRPPGIAVASKKSAVTGLEISTTSGASAAEVEEKPVQPIRSPEEGHVAQGEVKVK